jgi:hydroxymethylglutaryl-CoA reductase (NADPH)
MIIPSFLLAKLYAKGSLKNTDEGFEFSLKNIIDSTSLCGIGPIGVDGKTYGAESISLVVKDRTWAGAELSALNAAPVPVNVPFRVIVRGDRLAPGARKVSVVATSTDIGAFKFDLNDVIG